MKKTELYQISPEPLSLMMCYIVKTGLDKIIVIDGGEDGYGKEKIPYIPTVCRSILGLKENEYFEIEAWFLSHAHVDHFNDLAKLLKNYDKSQNFKINNIYFDFPPIKNGWQTKGGEGDYSSLDLLKEGLAHYADVMEDDRFIYDNVNGAVINAENIETGLVITIDDCDFEILQTWDVNDNFVNSTSIIVRLRTSDHTVLFLGDAHIDTGDRLLKNYLPSYLMSEYVQMAHHGQNGCSKEFYLAINADKSKRLWPSPAWVFNVYNSENHIKTDVTRGWMGIPENYEGFSNNDNDIVSGLYKKYPEDERSIDSWTKEILEEQKIF